MDDKYEPEAGEQFIDIGLRGLITSIYNQLYTNTFNKVSQFFYIKFTFLNTVYNYYCTKVMLKQLKHFVLR